MSEEMQTLLFAACLDLFKLNPACLSHFELALLGAHALFCILARGCSVRRASLRTSNQTLIFYHTLPKDLHTQEKWTPSRKVRQNARCAYFPSTETTVILPFV
jgi:hypothetical protein